MAVPHRAPGRQPLFRKRAPLVPVAFVLVTSVAAAAAAVSTTGRNFEQCRSTVCGEMAALALSEAGIGAASFDLHVGGSGNVGSEESPIRHGQGSYWVRTKRHPNEQYTLTSFGRVGLQLHRTVLRARARTASGTLELDAISRESAPMSQD